MPPALPVAHVLAFGGFGGFGGLGTVSALPAALAGLAVAVLLALPDGASERLSGVVPRPATSGPVRRLPDLPAVPLRLAAAVAAGAAGLVTGGPAAALVSCLVCAAGTAALSARRRRREAAAERAGAVEACAVLASELRAGRSPFQALEAAAEVAAGPLAERLAAAASAGRLGGDVTAGLLVPGRGSAVPEVVAGLAACWQVCAGTGSGLAAAVERLEEGLRSAEGTRRAVDAELAGPRATAVLLALLPVAGIGLAAALGARPLHVLLETPAGSACLVAGVALDLAGLAWTRRIAASATA